MKNSKARQGLKPLLYSIPLVKQRGCRGALQGGNLNQADARLKAAATKPSFHQGSHTDSKVQARKTSFPPFAQNAKDGAPARGSHERKPAPLEPKGAAPKG